MGPCRRAPCVAQRHTCRDASPQLPNYIVIFVFHLSHTQTHIIFVIIIVIVIGHNQSLQQPIEIKKKNGGETCPCLSESCPTPHTATHIFMLVEE